MGGAAAAASRLAQEDAATSRSTSGQQGDSLGVGGRANQAVSFDPRTSPRSPAAAEGSQRRAGAAAQDPGRGGGGAASSSSLHVSSRLAPAGVQGGLPAPAGAGAGPGASSSGGAGLRGQLSELDATEAEEAMQRAIEASLAEGLKSGQKSGSLVLEERRQSGQKSGALVLEERRPRDAALTDAPAAKDAGHAAEGKRKDDARGRTLASTGLARVHKPGYRSHDRPAKAPTLGLGGSAWVDNSDFHRPAASQLIASPDVAHPRSASCGARAGGGRSTIVSLPQIQRLPATEQQEMVKDLHESIKETVSSPDESPYGGGVHGGMSWMEELNMDSRETVVSSQSSLLSSARGSARAGAPRGAGFNAQFHSCRNELGASSKSLGTPRRRH